jgi:transcriptional regulator with XRE-family HTH domain
MELSKRIKVLRINKGLTQTDLSEKSGISLRTIQRIENNEVSPSIYSLKKISNVLDEDLNSFNNSRRQARRKFTISLFTFKSLQEFLWQEGHTSASNLLL